MSALLAAQLAKLSEFDFIVVVDASGSMTTDDVKGRTRWQAVQETAEQFTRDLAKLDSDGIGLVVFNGQAVDSFDGVDASKLAGKSDKKDFVIVFTDGVPDDRAAAAKVIVDASNKLQSDDELTFLFVQVGHDRAATDYLRELDDNLKGAKFDIVDAKTVAEAESFASTADLVLAAIDG